MKWLWTLLGVLSLGGDEVDDRIKQLNSEIKELRLKAMQEEVGGSERLRDNDKAVTHDFEEAEKHENELQAKEKELEALMHQKTPQ